MLIGKVAAVFGSQQKAGLELMFRSCGELLERLGRAAEEAAAVGQVLGTRGHCVVPGQLVAHVGSTSGNVRGAEVE